MSDPLADVIVAWLALHPDTGVAMLACRWAAADGPGSAPEGAHDIGRAVGRAAALWTWLDDVGYVVVSIDGRPSAHARVVLGHYAATPEKLAATVSALRLAHAEYLLRPARRGEAQ